mgnify:CR=1 FL=1|jgi:hypothetical protein|tara:strand:+ start:6184 stop:7107 length:924 start_codon:yes stop_codon:yes gene_type:complete
MNKIIAIGDLHGDFQIFIKILEMCNLINKNLEWIGGDTYLVQLGDTLDGKRPETKIDKSFLEQSGEVEIIRLILDLDAQAKESNGRVISLIGNHELYPYYLRNDKQFVRDYVKTKDIEQFRKVYNVDRVKFLMPGGIGGSLIGRTRPLILQLGEFIFIHGSITDKLIKNGLSSKTGKVDIDKINMETSLWLQGKGKIPKCLEEMDEENPVFSRLYSKSKSFNEKECSKFDKQLKFFSGANYVVMGHSRFKQINSACNNTLIRTDISLSRAFGGTLCSKTLQALEIIQVPGKKAEINIIGQTGKVRLS